MSVFRVQDTNNKIGRAGAVAPGFSSDYPGEAEVLSLGFAPGKSYDSVGIGRQGNFMLWGWSAAPSQMTLAGRNLFLNCICYIHQYDKKPFIKIRQISLARDRSLVSILGRMGKNAVLAQNYLSRMFPDEIQAQYGNRISELRKYYETNLEFVYMHERKFIIDQELKSLGLKSNRQPSTIKSLIELLTDKTKAQTAQKLLLRYTDQKLTTYSAWQHWYQANADQMFFSDTGGYRFYVIPHLSSPVEDKP